MGYMTISGEVGQVGQTLGDSSLDLKLAPIPHTLVYADVRPNTDDAGLTVDLQDDGTDMVAAVSCATAASGGQWTSKHFGGTQDPVTLAGGSVVSLDVNNAAADTRLWYLLVFLV